MGIRALGYLVFAVGSSGAHEPTAEPQILPRGLLAHDFVWNAKQLQMPTPKADVKMTSAVFFAK